METLEELGIKAYQKHMWKDYSGAIQIYNIAVKKYPKDPRLLNNRCCCYIELKDFRNALEDANSMTRLFPKHTKSHYRKGEVLSALKRYKEAEESFRKVLLLDPECEDARQQLFKVQTMQLCQLGYSKQDSLKALNLTLNEHSFIPNVEVAEKILKYGNLSEFSNDVDTDGVYYSDDENNTTISLKQDHSIYDPLMDPSNPLKSSSLWVGNITEGVAEKDLKDMFSKYGKILSVYVYYPNFCAFINYNDPVAPGKAMKALQGKVIGGKSILIKFPDSAANHNIKRSKAV